MTETTLPHNDARTKRSATVPWPDTTAAPVAISSVPGDGIVIVEGDLDVSALPMLTWRPVLLRPPPAASRLLSLTGLDKGCVIRP